MRTWANETETQDCGVIADCERCVREAVEGLGGLDVLIGNAVSSDSLFVSYFKHFCAYHSINHSGESGGSLIYWTFLSKHHLLDILQVSLLPRDSPLIYHSI